MNTSIAKSTREYRGKISYALCSEDLTDLT